MKKVFLFLSIITCITLNKSYSQSDTSSPSAVAMKYTKVMLSLNPKEAAKYVTKNDTATLTQLGRQLEAQKRQIPDSLRTFLNSVKVSAANEKINGDSAKVDVTTEPTKSMVIGGVKPMQKSTKTVSLVKENSLWKVLVPSVSQ